MYTNYKDNKCRKCNGNGWVIHEDMDGNEIAYPCDCEDGKKRAFYLRDREAEKKNE